MEKETFTLETEKETINCEVILRFFSKTYQKHYLVYTDHSIDEEGDENLFISSYNPNDNTFMLEDITDQEELEKAIEQMESLEGEQWSNQ